MILFELSFQVAPLNRQAFENVFAEVFQPALARQEGFISVQLVRVFEASAAREIQALPTEDDYRVLFNFESEALRRKWAKSADHDLAWPKLSALAETCGWRGFDVLRAAP